MPEDHSLRFARGPHRNHGCRIRDFLWRDQRCLSLENERLRAVFCASKGSDLIELLDKRTDTELLLQTQRGLPSGGELASGSLDVGAFRDVFPGGWYLMLPNGPEPCEHRGAHYGQHGEATFSAWDVDILEDRAEQIVVRFSTRLRRTPLAIQRVVALDAGSATLSIDEAVQNESGQTIELLWGHHPTFGPPFIEPGCRIDLPSCRASTPAELPGDAALAPGRISSAANLKAKDGSATDLSLVPEGPLHDFVRLDQLSEGWFAIRNDGRGVGIALRWDETLFKVLGCWRLLGGGADYPWFGRYFALALEPACDLPSVAAAAARGTAVSLDAQGGRSTRLEITLFEPRGAVKRVSWGGGINAD